MPRVRRKKVEEPSTERADAIDGVDNPSDFGTRLIDVCASLTATSINDWPAYPVLAEVARFNFNVEDPFGNHAAAGMVYGCLVAFEFVRRYGIEAVPAPQDILE